MANEQLTTQYSGATNSVMREPATIGSTARLRSKSGQSQESPDTQLTQRDTTRRVEEEEEEPENAELYVDDPEFDLEAMLKDESEDEEPQQNFEINQHKSSPITLEESHKYRNEIKDSVYLDKTLAPEKKA